ncbi:MAG: DUF1508 domain-containing protein [Candidatus Bathyarchaeota archaeon]|nr:DUF1508 domain-containing protein [Candidatus Bathyarchaeota archaeon]
MPAKYQVYKDIAGKYRFRLKAENNKIVAVSQAYQQYAGCMKGVKSVQKNCDAGIEDLTAEGKRLANPKYQVFYDKTCGFRFHLTARNGEIIATSEGYTTKDGCLNGINAVQLSCLSEIEDLVAAAKPAIKAETAMPPSVGIAETKLELVKLPEEAVIGDMITFQGKLLRSDTGEGVDNAKVEINERDRSFLNDELLQETCTKKDGSFSADWKVRKVDWWDNTAEIYAAFRGNEKAKASKTSIQTITIK